MAHPSSRDKVDCCVYTKSIVSPHFIDYDRTIDASQPANTSHIICPIIGDRVVGTRVVGVHIYIHVGG